MKLKLATWKSHTYEDITADLSYKYWAGASRRLRGTINSPAGASIIAFNRVESAWRNEGYIFASSTDFDLFYEIKERTFTIQFDGQRLGTVASDNSLVDAQGRVVGRIDRPTDRGNKFEYATGIYYYPITLHQRHLADSWIAQDYADSEFYRGKSDLSVPLLMMKDTPTPAEEKWLLALAILEITFYEYEFD
ncbi:MAG: hypothetical protein ACFB0B_10625 [Thermonemataceae bacterium]